MTASNEKTRWAAAHGSPRLRRCLAEGIECEAVYRDERLALEYPGWRREVDVPGERQEPRNPPGAAFELLDEARKNPLTQDAVLAFWVAPYQLPVPWRGYVAIASSPFGEIVYGGPL